MKWRQDDEQEHIEDSMGELIMDKFTPLYSFFDHVWLRDERVTWSSIVGIKFDAVDESWHYLLDTNYEEWVDEDDVSLVQAPAPVEG